MFKTKKIISKIICGTLIGLVLSLSQVSIVYAGKAPVPPPPPTPVVDCPADLSTNPPQQCKAPGENKCPAGYTVDAADKTKTLCNKNEADGASEEVSKDLLNTVAILTGIQGFLNKLIWPVLTLIGGLLDNDLLFAGGMGERLRDIWIPMRNLVNILFIIVLVGIALYNVLGLGDDSSEYSIKSALPKIVIGIIAINFSFLAIKVFLDLINVMTSSIFSLPGSIDPQLEQVIDPLKDTKLIKSLCANLQGISSDQLTKMSDSTWKELTDIQIARNVARKLELPVTPNADIATIEKAAEKANKKTEYEQLKTAQKNGKLCEKDILTPNGELFLKRYNSRNAAFALALNMGHIVFYNEVNLFSGLNPSNVEKLLTNAIFSMLLYLVYVASFLALFVVLLGRLIVMWLCVAVSPLLLLTLAAPSLKDKLGGFSKISEQFVKNAIAPILIALSMTVGWIMLRAVQGLSPGTDPFAQESMFRIDATGGIPVVGLSTLQDLVVALGVIGVVWLGVFSSAEGTLAEGATNWMKERLLAAGKWIGSVPLKHAAIVPIALPGHEHGHYTPSQVARALETIMTPDDNKLASLVHTGEKLTKPEDLRTATTKEGIVDIIKGMPDSDLGGDKFVKEFERELRNNRKFDRAFDKLQSVKGGSTEEDKLYKAIKSVLKGDLKGKKAADELKKHAKNASPTVTKPAAPPAPHIDPNKITQRPGEDGTKFQARKEKIQNAESTLVAEVQKKNAGTVRASIKELNDNGITLDEFKATFADQYGEMVKLFGGGEKGEKAIAAMFKGPATAPTGTGTTTGTPPTTPAPAPATPPDEEEEE